ncbi:MAG: hypothetical protein E7072_10690 [Bacteroidales bacterium]|nr:hypothetical protein [Bacteroidales bacterium]
MYRIGIIDDVKSERDDIQVSILDNVNVGTKIEFKEYVLEHKTKDSLFNEIREDVSNEVIQVLIVDFRLDTTEYIIKGWEIIEFTHNEFPEFPVVILTNAPDESKESNYTDADKVYAKKVFLNPQSAETKELVKNILLNINRYDKKRKELEAKLSVELQKLETDGKNVEILENIINIEKELTKYKQMYQTTIDTELEMDDLKEAFALLDKYENMLRN